jgi:hypothetical protein
MRNAKKELLFSIALGLGALAARAAEAQEEQPASVYGYVCSLPDYGPYAAVTLYAEPNCGGEYYGWYYLEQKVHRKEPLFSQTVNRLQHALYQQKQIYIAADADGAISYVVFYNS